MPTQTGVKVPVNFAQLKLGHHILHEDLVLRIIPRSVGAINTGDVAMDVEAYLESSARTVAPRIPGGKGGLLWKTEVGPING